MTELAVDEIKSSEFEKLLEYIKRNRGFDFTGYKRSSIMRRVDKRMALVGNDNYSDYIDYLDVHPDEFRHLFNTILINVTTFLRDITAWDYLSENIIPGIISNKKPDEGIRIWSAGCASGEEAYSIAMAMANALGIENYKTRVKIYATDVDEEALSLARRANYSSHDVSCVPPDYLKKYFERQGTRYQFNNDLHRSIVFSRHNLMKDAPLSRIDLLICRNTLMYFTAEVQAEIVQHLHLALADKGYLFLGKAEMLFPYTNLFFPFNLSRRIFTKVTKGNNLDCLASMAHIEDDHVISEFIDNTQIYESLFNFGQTPQIVVDKNEVVVLVNNRAKLLFQIAQRDIGLPLRDLEISYHPADLRSCIERVYQERKPILLKNIPTARNISSNLTHYDIQIVPLINQDGNILGATVYFIDVTQNRHLQDELLSAYEELQIINNELHRISSELDQRNASIISILSSLQSGVVVVNREMIIQIWNSKAEDLWGLRTGEVQDECFLNLNIGLPVDELIQPIQSCISGEENLQTIFIKAVTWRGKSILCKVTCGPLAGMQGDIEGVIMLMDEYEK